MKSVIDRMHENAMRQSRKAARLMREAAAAQESGKKDGRPQHEAVLKVIELNNKAIEEYNKSARTMDFLLRYQPPQPSAGAER